MEATKFKVCRLCLKVVYNNDYEITGEKLVMVKTIFVDLNWTIIEEPIMCCECSEKLGKSYNFKSMCLNTEEYIRAATKHNQDEVDLWQIRHENGQCSQEEKKICRFCLNINENNKCFGLDEKENVPLMLQKCLPELDLFMVRVPIICQTCFEAMESLFNFVTSCLSVEESINIYCNSEGSNSNDKVNLFNVLQFTKIKKESVGEDICVEEIASENDFGKIFVKSTNIEDIKCQVSVKKESLEFEEESANSLTYEGVKCKTETRDSKCLPLPSEDRPSTYSTTRKMRGGRHPKRRNFNFNKKETALLKDEKAEEEKIEHLGHSSTTTLQADSCLNGLPLEEDWPTMPIRPIRAVNARRIIDVTMILNVCQSEGKLDQMRQINRQRRAAESYEERYKRLEEQRRRTSERIATETIDERLHRLDKMRQRAAQRLSNETDERRVQRLEEQRRRTSQRIAMENEEERCQRLEKQRLRSVQRISTETATERYQRLEKQRRRTSQRIATETPEERAQRLEKQRLRTSQRRAAESLQERYRRLEEQRHRTSERIATETTEERVQRLEYMRQRATRRLADETNERRGQRLEEQRHRTARRRKSLEQNQLPTYKHTVDVEFAEHC